MGAIKTILVWTNPLIYIFGAPLMVGFILSAIFYGTGKRAAKIVRSLEL